MHGQVYALLFLTALGAVSFTHVQSKDDDFFFHGMGRVDCGDLFANRNAKSWLTFTSPM